MLRGTFTPSNDRSGDYVKSSDGLHGELLKFATHCIILRFDCGEDGEDETQRREPYEWQEQLVYLAPPAAHGARQRKRNDSGRGMPFGRVVRVRCG